MKQIKIACLPVAGIENPYQHLMIKGLNQNSNLNAFSGINDRFFGILRTAIVKTPDIIHFDWIESFYTRRFIWLTYLNVPFFFLQIFIVKYILRIKLVWTLHNIYPHDKMYRGLHQSVQRRFIKLMSWVRVFSDHSKQEAAQVFNSTLSKFVVSPEGSYVGYYPDTTNADSAKAHLHLPVNKKILLSIGSIKPYKGFDELIRVIRDLNDPNLFLVIAGQPIDKDFANKIKGMLTTQMIFIDRYIQPDELQYFFHAAHLVVLPFTEIENSGSVVLAMGFKKAIVAPRSNVLNLRLRNQQDLLYTLGQLRTTLLHALTIEDAILRSYGGKNYIQLTEHAWSDFGKFFQPDMHAI